jgi:alkanesulfonate monooxygenase SsuD/methylene tetrahydromethanopterin reductase-like flavin-dependent oxidoreductase (luciferase family)
MPKYGIAPLEIPINEGLKIVQEAEAAGFESAWVSGPQGYVRLAAFAQATKSIKLGTAVVVQPLMNPITHIVSMIDLQELSGGRCMFGIGSGVKPQLNRFFGIFGDQAEHPAPRVEEFIELIKHVMNANGEPIVWEKKFFQLRGSRGIVSNYPLPIYLAAVNKFSLKVAGRVADGLIGHPINSMQHLQNSVLPLISDGLKEKDRSRSDFNFSSDVITAINKDKNIARRDAAKNLGFYLSPKAFDNIFDAGGWEKEKIDVREAFRTGNLENVADAISDNMLDSCCLYGTPNEVRNQVSRYDNILDRVIFFSPRHGVEHEVNIQYYAEIIKTFGNK